MTKQSSKEKSASDLISQHEKEIAAETQRWNHIKKHGCSDPLYPDGCNMNLVRNHIIYHISEMRKLQNEPAQLSMFDPSPGFPSETILKDKRIPPKVPNSFMATDRELRIPWAWVD